MVRYKRYKKHGRRRSTNIIRMKFQSFMDISTSSDSMQIITISAGGKSILQRLAPQFGAYKYYKIGRISVKLVPASTLPVDPTGLSYEAGEQTVDPRDQLTPGLMRITNGEDVFENISGLTEAQQIAIYNNMLLDPRWFKWMLQSGVKRFGYPRYWQIGQLHQDKWPGQIVNLPRSDSSGDFAGTIEVAQGVKDGTGIQTYYHNGSSEYGLFQTGHKGVLGWLPTDGLQPTMINGSPVDTPFMASPPEVEVFKILLPKAYKTVYFYRAFITEEVLFREPIVNFGIPYDNEGSDVYLRPLDVFHYVNTPKPAVPGYNNTASLPTDKDTGGNYGDN